MSAPLFDIENVTKRFDGAPTEVLRGISFAVEPGESLAILGPSGSGKSTLLRLLNALDSPSTGRVAVAGRHVDQWDVIALRRTVAMLFQLPSLLDGTVRDNLMAPLRLRDGRAAQADEAWFARLLSGVGLNGGVLDRTAATLSGGEQQRVAFARALVLRPQAVLLDEPTASLDPNTSVQFLANLKALTGELGLTCVMVTHQLEHARAMADRVLLLVAGQVLAVQSAAEFFADGNEWCRRYLQGELGVVA